MRFKNVIILCLVLCFSFLGHSMLQAQGTLVAQENISNTNTTTDSTTDVNQFPVIRKIFEADAGEDRNALVGRQVLFNADQSVVTSDETEYLWNFGDGSVQRGVTVSHAYSSTGVYRVSLEMRDNNGLRDTDEIIVTVTKDIMVLIADDVSIDESFDRLTAFASSQGILIVPIIQDTSGPDHIVQKELAQKILDSSTDIRQAKTIIFWTDGSVGMNAFIDAYQPISDSKRLFKNKVLVNVSDSRLNSYRSFQNVISILKPQHLIIIPKDGLNYIVNTVNVDIMLRQLQDSGIHYQLLGIHSQRDVQKLGITNFLTYGVNYLVHQGVPLHNIYMILIIPIIATLIALLRQLIGIKTFGIYTPTIITLAFLSIGMWYGLLLFVVIMVVGTFTRLIGKRLRFLYVPRMAILLIVVSLAIIATYIAGIYFGAKGLVNVSILPILLLIILAENFIAAQMEKGTRSAIKLTLYTLGVSILSYYFVNWTWFKEILLGYPEIILLAIIVNIIIGRWTGLRLLEYYRFRKLLT